MLPKLLGCVTFISLEFWCGMFCAFTYIFQSQLSQLRHQLTSSFLQCKIPSLGNLRKSKYDRIYFSVSMKMDFVDVRIQCICHDTD